MLKRTTILLDEESQQAARELALRYGCSSSEAIRRAIVRHRDAVLGVPAKSRNERRKALLRLIDLFEGHSAEDEVRMLKEQDLGF